MAKRQYPRPVAGQGERRENRVPAVFRRNLAETVPHRRRVEGVQPFFDGNLPDIPADTKLSRREYFIRVQRLARHVDGNLIAVAESLLEKDDEVIDPAAAGEDSRAELPDEIPQGAAADMRVPRDDR